MQSNGGLFSFGENQRPIKPIETIYRGFKFRSRTEARYAVFFDWLRTSWEYEREGYIVNGVPYLPDFWLPDLKIHFETKGVPPSPEEFSLAYGLRDLTGNAVAVFHGAPAANPGMVFCWDIANNSGHGGCGEFEMQLSGMDFFGLTFYCSLWNDGDRTFFADNKWEEALTVHDNKQPDAIFINAVLAARQARFEQGADPRPSWLR